MNAGPEIWLIVTKVVLAGTRPEAATFRAASGPAFAMVTVTETEEPAITVAARSCRRHRYVRPRPDRGASRDRSGVVREVGVAGRGGHIGRVADRRSVRRSRRHHDHHREDCRLTRGQRCDRAVDRAGATHGGTGHIERRSRVLKLGDESGIGRHDVRKRHRLGIAGSGVRHRDRVGDWVARECRARRDRVRHRNIRLRRRSGS